MRVLDLFSGIGGFSLGLDSTGYFETVAFCEIEAFPCKILNKHWPDVPIYNDVRELSYERLQTDGIVSDGRRIDVICGGYPCQPFSVAGHQKGEADKRHLWPEYFRLVRELRPHYAIGENVGGHLRLGLDSVLEDLDSEDYTVRCFSVEAASLGAPHRRERIFWIADRNPNGSNVDQKQKVQERASAQSHGTRDDRTGKTLGNTECNGSSAPEIGGGNTKTPGRTAQGTVKALKPTGTGGSGDNEAVADSTGNGRDAKRTDQETRGTVRGSEERRMLESEGSGTRPEISGNVADNRGPRGQAGLSAPGHGQKGNPEEPDYDCGGQGRRPQSNKAAFESYLGGGTDGLSSWLDGTWERGIPRVAPTDKARVPRLKALGNAVVPQLVYWVGMAIVLSTMSEKRGDGNGR